MLAFLRFIAFAAVLSVGFSGFPGQVDAAKLVSVKVTDTARIPAIRPDWPVPGEPNQLFYLQRSSNSNTVVYTALFDAAGYLAVGKPAQAYWRRYNTTGERKALKRIEQRFAYGLNIKRSDVAGEFIVALKPLPQMQMRLRQTAPGKAELLATLGGKTVRAVYGFVTLDETGLIPKVTALTVHGIDLVTGRAISEKFSVSGGAITQ